MNTLEDRLRAALAAKSDAVAFSMLTRSVPTVEADPESAAAPVLLLPPHQQHRSRRLVAVALAVAAVLLVAFGAVALHRATSDKTLGPAHVRPRSAIPWSQVGSSWTLEFTYPNGRPNANQTLYLIDPSGQRWYRICQVDGGYYFDYYAWSRDTGRAIAIKHQPGGPSTILTIDLHTGQRHSFTIPGAWANPQLVNSGSDSMLMLGSESSVVRVTSTGQIAVHFPGIGGIPSPDGVKVAVTSQTALMIFDAASGKPLSTLPAPSGYEYCLPDYWQAGDATIVALCQQRAKPNPVRRYEFSLDRGRPPAPVAMAPGWAELHLVEGANRVDHASLSRYAARVGPSGTPNRFTVPDQLQRGDWELQWLAGNTFLAERISSAGSTDSNTALSWNLDTGTVIDLHTYRPPGTSVGTIAGWQP